MSDQLSDYSNFTFNENSRGIKLVPPANNNLADISVHHFNTIASGNAHSSNQFPGITSSDVSNTIDDNKIVQIDKKNCKTEIKSAEEEEEKSSKEGNNPLKGAESKPKEFNGKQIKAFLEMPKDEKDKAKSCGDKDNKKDQKDLNTSFNMVSFNTEKLDDLIHNLTIYTKSNNQMNKNIEKAIINQNTIATKIDDAIQTSSANQIKLMDKIDNAIQTSSANQIKLMDKIDNAIQTSSANQNRMAELINQSISNQNTLIEKLAIFLSNNNNNNH